MVERDNEGRPSKWVTELEPEFDVNERDSWHALAEYEDALCPQCGRLRSVCEDPEQAWYPQRHVCLSTAARASASRRFQKIHEKTEADTNGAHPTDGVLVWVSDDNLTPDDDFLNDATSLIGPAPPNV